MKALLIAIALLLSGCDIQSYQLDLAREYCRKDGGIGSIGRGAFIGRVIVTCRHGRTYDLKGNERK